MSFNYPCLIWDLCGMDAGIQILLFDEELQGLCLMMGYDLYYHMQLL